MPGGVEFEEYDQPGLRTVDGLRSPVGKAAWFKDSEGNVLTITHLGYGAQPIAGNLVPGWVAGGAVLAGPWRTAGWFRP